MNQFNATYPHLDNRYFHTIWAALPEEANDHMHEFLAPSRPFCTRLATHVDDKNDSLNKLHITLRYLGYSDELDAKQIREDVPAFKSAVVPLLPFELNLGAVTIWQRDGRARLNWTIQNSDQLMQVHEALLQVSGYAFFSNLEGEHYSPHISLGEIDMSEPENLTHVQEYLVSLKVAEHVYQVDKLAINLAFPDRRESIVL